MPLDILFSKPDPSDPNAEPQFSYTPEVYKYLTQIYDEAELMYQEEMIKKAAKEGKQLEQNVSGDGLIPTIQVLLCNFLGNQDPIHNKQLARLADCTDFNIEQLGLSNEGERGLNILTVIAAFNGLVRNEDQEQEIAEKKWNTQCADKDPKEEWEKLERNWKTERYIWSDQLEYEKETKKEKCDDILNLCDLYENQLEQKLNKFSRKEMHFFLQDRITAVKEIREEIESIRDKDFMEYNMNEKKATKILNKDKLTFINSKEGKSFFEDIQGIVRPKLNGIDKFNSYKGVLISIKNSTEGNSFGESQQKYLITTLNRYKKAREAEISLNPFGFTKKQKVDAVSTLIDVLEGKKAPSELNQKHKDALNNGFLSTILNDFVKSTNNSATINAFLNKLPNKSQTQTVNKTTTSDLTASTDPIDTTSEDNLSL